MVFFNVVYVDLLVGLPQKKLAIRIDILDVS